ncbi:hypothetical protein ACQJBY_012317 [Aegilops geniculata]
MADASAECLDEYVNIVSRMFDSEDEGFEFYNKYALEKGFSVRKGYVEWDEANEKIILRKLVCSREGCRDRRICTKLEEVTRSGRQLHAGLLRRSNALRRSIRQRKKSMVLDSQARQRRVMVARQGVLVCTKNIVDLMAADHVVKTSYDEDMWEVKDDVR